MITQGYAKAAGAMASIEGTANSATRVTEASRLADRMNSAMITLNGMVGRLSRAVDRINGPALQGGEGKSDAPTPAGHVFAMDAGFNDIEAALGRFRNEVERLEAFA